MARRNIDVGTVGNDGTGDSIRDSFRKVNDNFRELYSSLGLGERLTFIGLDDTPISYEGQIDIPTSSFATPVLTVNNTEDGVQFKQLKGGDGITIDWGSNENEISIVNEFNNIASFWDAETNQNLGGNLSARAGDNQYRITNLPEFNRNWFEGQLGSPGGPISSGEAVSKSYTDSFVSRAGVNAIDPATFRENSAFGRMSGPLILSRNPNPDDDEIYEGLIAATKQYVDQASFGSKTNVYVSTGGSDNRGNLSLDLQGSSLSYAFRSIEAALKKAEQLLEEAPADIGPYKKTLTYGNRAGESTLDFITESPESGSGFTAVALMSADTVSLNSPGSNYFPGDIIELTGGSSDDPTTPSDEDAQYREDNNITNPSRVASPIKILVLATASTPGAISSFRVISTGSYSTLPGTTNIPVVIAEGGGPPSVGPIGLGATFDVTYKVNNVKITDSGSGYGLVSVRIEGGGGAGAFGTADVDAVTGAINSITITDQGSGFTSIPTVISNLPRFCIFTNGLRTDFTGNVLVNNDTAFRGRDLREGLYLKGETSGAIAQILTHSGQLGDEDGEPAEEHGFSQASPGPTDLYELFDVDIKIGKFIPGEVISYGDITVTKQVSVLIESGTYEENYPLKIPRNVAIIGDEFRRVIIKPKAGFSSSSWALNKFRRDRTIGAVIPNLGVADELEIASRNFGYHYLTDSSRPVWPRINNRGSYRAAPALLQLNKSFIQEEVVSWIDKQIEDDILPFSTGFTYDRSLCRRDIGFLIDAMIFDLKYGEHNKTISAALRYGQNASGQIAIIDQLDQTVAAINYLNAVAQQVLANEPIDVSYQSIFVQSIDTAFVTETLAFQVVEDLTDVITGIITDLSDLIDGGWVAGESVPNGYTLNPPKKNDDLDVFLCNDAVIIRAVTCQGHGGFMMVLDPTGQILTKSPYAQESASFSKSIDRQIFAGGMYVDGFAGNLQFKHDENIYKLVQTEIVGLGGNGYAVNDILTIDGGVGTRPAKLRVQTVGGGGAVASVTIIDPGSYSVIPSNPAAVLSTSGSGVGFNLTFNVTSLRVSELDRYPELPSSFLVNDVVYRINYVRDFLYSPTGSTATLVLDESTPFPYEAGSSTCTISVGDPAVITNTEHKLQPGAVVVFNASTGGTLPAGLEENQEYYVLFEGLTENQFEVTDQQGSKIPVVTTNAGTGTFTYQRIYEILTPGNRSMLGNDYTQINDLGYGIVANNGGLIEAVGMFTYYCWISYYSCNGGQIRSVGGSSSHGKYALVAQGSDPLELPTPTSLYEEYSQKVECYAPDPSFDTEAGGFLVWVNNYSYTPLNESELEVDHGDNIVRYPVGAISTSDLPAGVARISIANQSGLEFAIPDGTKMTLRCVSRIVLTGDLTGVAVRPSTGLIMNDLPEEVYRVLQFSEYEDPNGPYEVSASTGLFTSTQPHRLREGYEITFASSGTLPAPLDTESIYYVIGTDLTPTTFRISTIKNGVGLPTTTSGSGVHTFSSFGLTTTRLRENYNYIELTMYTPGAFSGDASTGDGGCTFTTVPLSDIVVNVSGGHSLLAGDVIKFEVDGELDVLPAPLVKQRKYHVVSAGLTGTQFKISNSPGGLPIKAVNSGSGIFYYGKIIGEPGDNQLAVVSLNSEELDRVIGSKFVFLGNEHTVTDYSVEIIPTTNDPYGLVTISPALSVTDPSPIQYTSTTTLKAGSPAGTVPSDGFLTVRISLTRVTGHDLLDIGTGSYKETNYPNEIYGAAENPANPDNETQERGVGRTFYVTTDQFGNFNVGPFFRVDQGTGTVTFSANIALSNLDGLGFKRGVPISEFSTDTNFGGGDQGAIDKVPVEYATRIYIDRRLGLSHKSTGNDPVDQAQLIPPVTGGFMSLDGQLEMNADMRMGDNKIVSLSDPTDPQDAVNKRFLKFSNLNDLTVTPSGTAAASQFLAFTGTQTDMVNVTMSGDLSAGTIASNALPITVVNGAITNAKVNASAAIVQSKLAMNAADTFVESTGWTGAKTQADLGLAKFSANNFENSDGYIRIKDNGIVLAELQQIASGTVLGNNSGSAGAVSAIAFSTIADAGGSIKKLQYSSTGFLRRSNAGSGTNDTDYSVVDMIAGYSGATANNTLVQRDSSGGFGANIVTVERLNIGNGVSNNSAIVRTVAGTGGTIQYFGYNNAGGIIIGGGSNAPDRTTKHLNDSHSFRNSADTAAAPIIASSIQVTALTTGGNTTAGTITGRWTLTGTSPSESRLQATYSADLAEYYEGDREYEVGTVLVFGGDKEVTLSNKQGDTRVAGVVSNTAAFVMYDACPGFKNLIALQGRVPCKVVGKIKKGDMLVTSRIPGVAVATEIAQAGTIVGKALENYDSDHIGTIEVAVGRN
jgi:hypothetical protein